MFEWWNKLKLAHTHRTISQNFSTLEVAMAYYAREQDDATIKDLEALYLGNLRIANVFFAKNAIAPADHQRLTAIHAQMREIFQRIYPGKSFDRTFVPGWTSDSEIKD